MAERTLESIGKSAYESIAEMVAALECDYDRLDELVGKAEEDADNRAALSGDELNDYAPLLDGDELDELAELRDAAGDCESREDAEQRIQDDPLSIEVRSGWTSIGEPFEAEEFCILLTTGGPAVRIVGDIDQYGEPSRPRLQVQDWGTPWTEYFDVDQDVLLTYCRQFYFTGG